MQWINEPDNARLGVFVDLARRGAELRPDDALAWRRYAMALADAGAMDERIDVLTGAVARLSESVVLRTSLSRALFAAGRFDHGIDEARAACSLAPDDRHARRALFDAFAAAGRLADARLLVEPIAHAGPCAGLVLDLYARMFGPEAIIALCDRYLAEQPGHTDARYQKAVALAQLGRADEARAAMTVGGALAMSELEPPSGFDGIEAFNGALAAEIRRNPSLKPDPRAKATRGGLQCDRLVQPDSPATIALLREIRRAVDAYEAERAGSPDPFFVHRPREVRLNSWAVIYGKEGRQVAHRHPDGWISGIYYVAAPRLGGRNAWQGSLLFGALDEAQQGVAAPWEVREVEPVPGRLLLFPSFVPHATEPTGVDGARISVAFDVVPADD